MNASGEYIQSRASHDSSAFLMTDIVIEPSHLKAAHHELPIVAKYINIIALLFICFSFLVYLFLFNIMYIYGVVPKLSFHLVPTTKHNASSNILLRYLLSYYSHAATALAK